MPLRLRSPPSSGPEKDEMKQQLLLGVFRNGKQTNWHPSGSGPKLGSTHWNWSVEVDRLTVKGGSTLPWWYGRGHVDTPQDSLFPDLCPRPSLLTRFGHPLVKGTNNDTEVVEDIPQIPRLSFSESHCLWFWVVTSRFLFFLTLLSSLQCGAPDLFYQRERKWTKRTSHQFVPGDLGLTNPRLESWWWMIILKNLKPLS